MPAVLLSIFCNKTYGQHKPFTEFDTVKINQVVVKQTVPLNDESMVNHYQVLRTTSLDKINARLGGVSVMSRGPYAMEPMLNSFSAGQINVTIGGMKMFGACTGKMDPITSYVEPVNLKNIQLSHGSNGCKNGCTIGGTYNMSLREAKKSLVNAEAGVHYETVSKGKTGFLVFNYGRKKWAYRVSGVYKKYEPYTDGNGHVVPFSQYGKVNLQQSLLFTPAKGHNLVFDYLIDDARNVGYPGLPMDVKKAEGRIYSLEYSPDVPVLHLSGFKVKVYANTVFHLMDDSHRDSLYFVNDLQTGKPDSVYMHMSMPGWSNTYGGYAEGNILWSARDLFSFKLEDYLHWSKAQMTMYMNNLAHPGEPPMFAETWPENHRHATGLYLQNTHQLSNKITLSVNLRTDFSTTKILSKQGRKEFSILGYNTGKSYDKLLKSANINLHYSIGQYLEAKAGIGYGERLPTVTEQFGFYLYNAMDGYDYIGNPDIKTEQSIHIWGSLNYTRPKIKLAWENYFNHVYNYILGVTKPEYEAFSLKASGVKQYENLPFARTFATNMQMLWKPFSSIEVFDVLKYNFAETNLHKPLPLIPPLKDLLLLTWKKPHYYLQVETEYADAQHRIDRNFGEIPSSSFMLLDFRSEYNIDLKNAKLHISFGVENILNKAYSEHLDWGNYNRPGRNFYLGLDFNY